MPFVPTMKHYKNRIALCTMRDVVERDGNMSLSREPIMRCWASIQAYKNVTPMITADGYSVLIQETSTMLKVTHVIYVQAKLGLEYTAAAWAYEERLKSPPRWYKIFGFAEEASWIRLPSRLMEKSDFATPPRTGFSAQPTQVQL
jgi:hypothetical protein